MGKGEGAKGRGWKILGYSLVGLGALSILDFFSPIPIPTVGAAALISGVLIMAAGGYILYLREVDWKSLFRRAVTRGEEPQAPRRPALDPLVPVSILKLAREKGGLLTVSTVAMELGLPLDVAEAGLDECARRGAAAAEYDETRSTVTYRFPEFLPPSDRPPDRPRLA